MVFGTYIKSVVLSSINGFFIILDNGIFGNYLLMNNVKNTEINFYNIINVSFVFFNFKQFF